MPSITLLVKRLEADFPKLRFAAGDTFRWAPDERTVYYIATAHDEASLLHEVSHALLNHSAYMRDIQLLELERDAWRYATKHLGSRYEVTITEEETEDALDTYRDWLHARSTCPGCHATGIQTKKNEYKCIACMTKWRVNDARACALRRYTTKK